MKPGDKKQQFVWKDGKRVPFNVTAVKPKKPEDYDPKEQEEQQETAKAAGSK